MSSVHCHGSFTQAIAILFYFHQCLCIVARTQQQPFVRQYPLTARCHDLWQFRSSTTSPTAAVTASEKRTKWVKQDVPTPGNGKSNECKKSCFCFARVRLPGSRHDHDKQIWVVDGNGGTRAVGSSLARARLNDMHEGGKECEASEALGTQ